MSPELATHSLISRMSAALDRLNNDELEWSRFRDLAYNTSSVWATLNLIPQYEYQWLDEAALVAQRARRLTLISNMEHAA